MTGLMRKCFHRATSPQGYASPLLHPILCLYEIWLVPASSGALGVTINWATVNSQFGVLAAVWWLLAGQDLEAFKMIEDLVGSSL